MAGLIGLLLTILIALIVLGVFYYIAKLIIGIIPMDAPFKDAALKILLIIVLLIGLVWLMSMFGVLGPGYYWRVPLR